LRPTLIAGIGGLVLGHILWLIGISFATSGADISFWVLILSAVIVVVAAVVGYLAWRSNQRKSKLWAAFLGCVPVSPVIFTLIVLGVTYL
jgi:cytochrome bd-type quinol oxidase subunit 2